MSEIGYLAGLVVAVALVWAAVAKLADPADFAATVSGLGLPSGTATVVPWVEIGVAATLAAYPAYAAVPAAALMVAFVGISIRAARRHVPCRCFGAVSSEPPGPDAVVRNVMLAVAALAALATTEPVAPSWPAVITVGLVGASAAMIVALVRARSILGTLWRTDLPGEGVAR